MARVNEGSYSCTCQKAAKFGASTQNTDVKHGKLRKTIHWTSSFVASPTDSKRKRLRTLCAGYSTPVPTWYLNLDELKSTFVVNSSLADDPSNLGPDSQTLS